MAKNEQFEVLVQILRRFHNAGVLNEFFLIGSWCLYFYRFHFDQPQGLPAFRTLDVDFLVPNAKQVKKEVDVSQLLKDEGFVPTFNRSSGLIKYNHPELQVEFLVPELGKGRDEPVAIESLHINAQSLRYLNLLMDYPRIIAYEEIKIRVPEPAAFAIHKLMISARRGNQEKQKADLETSIGLLEFLYARPEEVARIKAVLRAIPKSWKKTILSLSGKHFSRLKDTAENL
ncbi:MAG: GSU2403 family nucleotidyltransferase fold protein [Candidatus Omnitrophica bacterium]|nr:GSU2403 family nucleotidyltransferase fold protein [Candidatus Omnitrophota bacterium]MDD5671440.1 GSU2403 family nucleotidyltransferase fold protein [Candidatus Omnitrophota bacterium]